MPTWVKDYREKGKEYLRMRNGQRKRYYSKHRYGKRTGRRINWMLNLIVRWRLISDKRIAKVFGCSVGGVQTLRWRIKNDYKGLYGR